MKTIGMFLLLLVLITSIASKCAPEKTAAEKLQAERELSEISARIKGTSYAKRLVRMHLRDPDSAEFGEVVNVGGGHICGTVNGKNGFGGYTGSQGFIVSGDVVALEESSNERFGAFWREACLGAPAKKPAMTAAEKAAQKAHTDKAVRVAKLMDSDPVFLDKTLEWMQCNVANSALPADQKARACPEPAIPAPVARKAKVRR